MNNHSVHQKFFHILLFVVTVALCWILLPFFGAIFWGTILAILFQPLQRYLAVKFGKRRNLAAFATLGLTIVVVILPLSFVAATLVQEIGLAYTQIKAGQPNFTTYFQQAIHALPNSLQTLLGRFGLTDIPSIQRNALLEASSMVAEKLKTISCAHTMQTWDYCMYGGVWPIVYATRYTGKGPLIFL